MLIKIFGMVIATGKDKEIYLTPQIPPTPTIEIKEPVAQTNLVPSISEKAEVVVRRPTISENKSRELFIKTIDPYSSLHPITRAIVWPDPGDDSFKRSVTHKEIIEFDTMAKNGWFDICPISNLVKKLGITMTNSGGVAYRKLHDLHCSHWETIEEDFIKILPALVSEVFVGVQFPEENDDWIPNNYKF